MVVRAAQRSYLTVPTHSTESKPGQFREYPLCIATRQPRRQQSTKSCHSI